MKRVFIILFFAIAFLTGKLSAQSFDWNLRGGINMMQLKPEGKGLAVLYHAGAQAGIRITSFGFYGEALYSVHEDQNGGDPIPYFVPSLVVKVFLSKLFFVELGGSYMSKIEETEDPTLIYDMNPDDKLYMLGGLGAKFSKFQLSLRSTLKQEYGLIQLTAAIRF
jgi:hypothetical protein